MLPAVLVSGFLGAGKTTQINAMIGSRPDLRIAVIENEAGDVAVDADLVRGAAQVVEVAGGCACCTVRGAMATALELVVERAHELDALVIEASGIADPVPIVQSLQTPALRSALRLTSIVGVVDIAALAASAPPSPLWSRQLRYADRAVITKAEMIPESRRADLWRRVGSAAPQARVIDGRLPDEALRQLLSPTGERPLLGAPEPDAHPPPDHGFSACALRVPGPLDAAALDAWLTRLLTDVPGVLRVKGTVPVAGHRARYVIQATQQQLDLRPDPRAAGAAAARLVVVGHDLDPEALQRGLEACAAPVTLGTR